MLLRIQCKLDLRTQQLEKSSGMEFVQNQSYKKEVSSQEIFSQEEQKIELGLSKVNLTVQNDLKLTEGGERGGGGNLTQYAILTKL